MSPVVVEVLHGGAVVDAVASVTGNVGSGYLTTLVTNIAARLRGGRSSDLGEVRELLNAELRAALDRGDVAADEARESLVGLLGRVGGLEAAVGELHDHLVVCFEELNTQVRGQMAELGLMHTAQRRHTRQLQRQERQLQEIVDRLRLFSRDAGRGAVPSASPVITPTVVPVTAQPGDRSGVSWSGGSEVAVGDRVYLLHDVLCAEHTDHDGAVWRRARALRLVPSDPRDRYVWLRQVQVRPDVPQAGRALAALDRERRLLSQVGGPRVGQYEVNGHTSTLALSWPTSRSAGPGEVLSPSDPPEPFSLLGGLAGLCEVLARLHALGAAHRFVTPERIVVCDDSQLALLDLGLAGHDYTPGEGPADYQAPEQRRRGATRPGGHTDVYQLAAVAYHLLSGHPPHPRTPLPVRSQARDLPVPVGAVIDAALSTDPDARPTARSFGAALRAARDQL